MQKKLEVISGDGLCFLVCLCYNKKTKVVYFGTYIQPGKIGVWVICVKKK